LFLKFVEASSLNTLQHVVFNIGNDAAETLYGSDNSDIVKGNDGNDVIYAGTGNDYIEGGLGNDSLKGEAGNDIYKFNLGDGQDTIEDNSGADKILFGTNITQASLTFAKTGNDLIVNVGTNAKIISRICKKTHEKNYHKKTKFLIAR
jgi:Ca2+-binding RTX toxin-like protein